MVKDYKSLNVWKKAIELVTIIYKTTELFPKQEHYGLTSQIRKSAVSVPSNIAEGNSRASTKEYIHFLCISLGSSAELETQIIISKNIGYIDSKKCEKILSKIIIIRKMLPALSTKLKEKI